MRLDSHQHFWLYEPEKDAWITDKMKVIQRNFLPNDIAQTLKLKGMDGVVAVQADQSLKETEFLVELADVYKLIKAVVGWVDLRADDVEEQLGRFVQQPIVKGFRHIVEGEEDPDFLTQPAFRRGIEALTKKGYTYDLLIAPRHYASTLACVAHHPHQHFMLDHMAKPAIASQEFEAWADFISALSVYPNVYCKLSGLVTEASWDTWSVADFGRYIKHVIACFGRERLCFGSDWPVSLLAATYDEVMMVAETYLTDFSELEKSNFWGGNAARFYGIT